MEDKKRLEIMKLCKKIEDKNGEGSIYSLGSKKANMNIPRISTIIYLVVEFQKEELWKFTVQNQVVKQV